MALQKTDGTCALILGSILGVGALVDLGAAVYQGIQGITHASASMTGTSSCSLPGAQTHCDETQNTSVNESVLANLYSEKSDSNLHQGLKFLAGATLLIGVGTLCRSRNSNSASAGLG